MPAQRPVYYDQDAEFQNLEGVTIAVIGYGSQGRAQARMLYESGVSVVVGAREGGQSWQQAQTDGLPVASIAEASQQADVIHILIPDELQKQVYEEKIAPNLEEGNVVSFSHGFNIVYSQIQPPENVGVIMVAPKSPGTEEYQEFKKGFGVPALFAVAQENSKNTAKPIALAMCKAMGFTKAGTMEATFEEEVYEDLFGEQAVLCGGASQLVKYGFEVLTEAGYPPEFAYFECLHELKLIVDLMYQGGLTRMWDVVSNTAEYGGLTRGSKVLPPETKERMKEILQRVEDGSFAREYLQEFADGFENMEKMRNEEASHEIEQVGQKVRGMFRKGENK
jgi:ketol-acid reductoisomerase